MWLFLIFVVLPIAEIFVIIKVGQAIGALWTIALIVASSIFGFFLAKHEGIGVWRRFQEQTRERRPPTKEVVDGVLILAGGVLMFLPGFITGFVGLLLLIPPIRSIPRGFIMRRTGLRYVGGGSSTGWSRRPTIWVENTADGPHDPPAAIEPPPDVTRPGPDPSPGG